MKSTNAVYSAIIKALEDADTPLSAPQLIDIPEVRQVINANYMNVEDTQSMINKLSDVLGLMSRQELIKRLSGAVAGTRVKYLYGAVKRVPPRELPAYPSSRSSAPASTSKPVFTVIESGNDVTLEFEYFTLIVKKR
jgi:hypothetical protein